MDFLNWNDEAYLGGEGVLTGCDERQEWMLKCWWDHYSKTNSHPVTFFDFGMSKSARLWCEKRGHTISFSLSNTFMKENEPFPLPKTWTPKQKSGALSQRKIWFTKAFSLLQTPYENSLWTDLDCQVKGSLTPLLRWGSFGVAEDYFETSKEWKKVGYLPQDAVGYQAGVIVFKRHSPIINAWLKNCYLNRKEDFSDQSILSKTLHHQPFSFHSIPSIYNWIDPEKENPDAVIVHHAGNILKRKILKELGLHG